MEAARCQCEAGGCQCHRDATQEDMLCDVCRALERCVDWRRDRAERARLDAERDAQRSLMVSPDGLIESELEAFGGQ